MNHIGLNILSNYVDYGVALGWLRDLRPAAVLLMDNFGFAERVAEELPGSFVIHRVHDRNDPQWHETDMSATALVDTMRPSERIYHQLFNEPSGYGDLPKLAAYCAAAMDHASNTGRLLCLPNFGVGHPDENRLDELGELWDAFNRHPEHILGVHEYFLSDPLREPWHVGRYRSLRKYIPKTQIVVTEYGRDRVEHGRGGGPEDGWNHTGWSQEEYFEKLIAPIRAGVYDGVALCLFCLGHGANNMWASFNVEHAGKLRELLKTVKWRGKTEVTFDWGTKQRMVVKSTDGNKNVNVRAQPDVEAAVIGSLRKGGQVEVYANKLTGGEYRWHKVEIPAEGYVASEVITFEPVGLTVPEQTIYAPMTVEDIQRLIVLHNQKAANHRLLAASHTAQAKGDEEIAQIYQRTLARMTVIER